MIFSRFQTRQIPLFLYVVTYWTVEKIYYLFHTIRMMEHGNFFVTKNIMKATQG